MPETITWTFEPLSDYRAVLGESPEWDPVNRCVWWVDIDGKMLCHTHVDSGETKTWKTPELIGFVAPVKAGVVVGMERGLYLFDADTGAFELFFDLGETGLRFNDATRDSTGTIWAGTMDVNNVKPVGTLFKISPDLQVQKLFGGLTTINGLAIDETRAQLYLSDSHPSIQTIWTMPSNADSDLRKTFCDMNALSGRPDGGAVAPDGTYWIAGVGGAVLHGFAPDGTHLYQVSTPMADPTKLLFVDDHAYLTSKTDGDTGKGGWLSKVTPTAN